MFFSLMGIISLLTVLTTWVYSTENGLKWSLQQVQKLLPQALSIREISGSLNDQLLLHEVLWQQQEVSIKIPEILLQCHWFDLISSQLNCDKIDITSIIINNYQRDTDVTNEADIPDLPQFVVPIDIDIQSIRINQINLNSFTSNHSLLAENSFTEIQFKQLKYQQSTFSVDDISFDSNQIKVQLNGNFRPDKNWSHQLDLTVNAADFGVSLSSNGSLNSLSHFKIKSFSPVQAEASGDWFWNKGPFIRNAIYQANSQHITIQQQEFELNDLLGKFELDWPKFNSQATVDGNWQQYKNIQIHAEVNSQDLSNWQNQSQLDLQLKGLIADTLIRETIQPLFTPNNLTANQSVEKSWPVDVTLSAKVEHGSVQLESHNIQFGRLFGHFNGSLNIQQDALNSLTLAAELKAASLDTLIGFPLTDFTMAVKYYHHQGDWILDTQGQASNVQHPDFSINNLNWKINLGKQWNGNIQAKKIELGQAVFEQPILHIMGSANKHYLSVKTIVKTLIHDNQDNIPKPITINFDGKLEPTNDPTQWIIENLDAIIPLAETELSVAADKIILSLQQQQFNNLCLKNIGKACVSGTYSDAQGSASFKFDNWSLTSVIDIAKIFSPLTDFSLAGTIDGTAELAGSTSQIEKMRVNLTVPELRLESLTGKSVWQNLTIQSAKNGDSYNISLNWFNSQLDIKSDNWLSTINIPTSQLIIDLKSTDDINLLLLQKNIDWTLPFHPDNENKIVYSIPSLQLHANLARNKLATELEILLPEKDHLSASLSSTWPLTPDAEIAGSIDLFINHFEGLKHWQPNIDAIDMSLQEKAVLSGSWQEPIINGQGKLQIKQLTLDELGLDVTDSYLSLTNDKQKVTINGVLKNLAGEVNVSGVATLYPEISASVNLIGRNYSHPISVSLPARAI